MSTFAEILKELSKPFSTKAVQWRPGATNKDKTRAQALAYVDVRHYMDRLDAVAPDWRSEVQPLGNGQVLVRLTVGGVTRTDVGEADPQDANTLTSAFAQAFKRACAQFGLGRYLYHIPKMWCDYDSARKVLLETPILPEWAVPEEERSWYSAAQNLRVKGLVENEAPKEVKPPSNGKGKGEASNGQSPANVVIRFGKHQGKTLGQILAEDRGYLQWLAENSSNKFIAGKARQLLASKPQNETEIVPAPEPALPPEPEAEQNDPFEEIPF